MNPAQAWYLARGGRPVPAAEWRGKAPPDWFCREGDKAWSAFDPAASSEELKDRSTMTARTLTAILILTFTAQAHAGCRWRASRGRQACPTASYAQTPAPALATPQAAAQSDYGAALALVNAERARNGRGPLRWSASLAGYAAGNAGVHQPGTNGGAGQCWAGVADPVQAVGMWLASPPHRAILLGASGECGISRCPSGMTANAR